MRRSFLVMKFPLLKCNAVSLHACFLITTAGVACAQGDLEKARALFPAFSKAVYTDEDKAEEIYQTLAALSPSVQQRLLNWLDHEFADKKAAYQKIKSGGSSNFDRRPGSSDQSKIKALQLELREIRNTSNEAEMKKKLKETGYPTLKKLLSLKGSTIRSLGELQDSQPDPAKAKALRKQALQVGKFRHELRNKLKQEVMDVEAELDRADDTADKNEASSIDADRKAASILVKNEKMKGEISSKEYKGILEANHWRIAAGMQPLLIDPKLCEASRDHRKDMEELNFFAHDSPVKGKTKPWDRAKNFGASARGENIAINDSIEASNMAWFYSPGHHKNMFKPDYSVIGLGIHGRHYCQLFR